MTEFKRDQYQILFEHSADAMLIIDHEKFVDCNDAVLKMMGYANREEMLQTHPSQLSPSHQPDGQNSFDKANEMISIAMASGSHRFVWIHTRANGEDFPVEVLLTAIPFQERKLIHVVWRNISKRLRLEEELANHRDQLQQLVDEQTRDLIKTRDAAEAANRVKSLFLGSMSHELRTPLNAIIGFSDAMKTQIFGAIDNPKYEEYVDLIYGSGKHLLQLIDDILDVSAIEAGELSVDEVAVDIEDIISACQRLVEQRAAAAGVCIYLKVPNAIPPLFIDERRIKQIILNLLTNSIKFTPEGGSITIESGLNDKGDLLVSVADTGIGMTDEDISIALTQFGQVDQSLIRNNEGTGLGLPITKSLVEMHDGSMEISSTPGEGTKVRLTFPSTRLRQ
ncbi:MAG: PAS domain-containing protein [Rhodospirillaceae bacterium]|nr:PAS domain-containing protein [Rhodospirillaceae bacterium]MBT6241236.1 PAS domain-containing protein [Rhodospirillaceae bacterium]MBT7138053.1 PAS domain-containing protein [Rhodospirillaceae bacterium]